jgi:hypothetical protein
MGPPIQVHRDERAEEVLTDALGRKIRQRSGDLDPSRDLSVALPVGPLGGNGRIGHGWLDVAGGVGRPRGNGVLASWRAAPVNLQNFHEYAELPPPSVMAAGIHGPPSTFTSTLAIGQASANSSRTSFARKR